jgi:uncharacterized protein (TIGR03435 family)
MKETFPSMSMQGVHQFNLEGKLLSRAIAVITVAVLAGFGFDSHAAPADKPLTYDVVSVRLAHSEGGTGIKLLPDGFSMQGATAKKMILIAGGLADDSGYGLHEGSKDVLISGLPNWAESMKFDVQAKMDEETAAAFKNLPVQQQKLQRLQMLRSLLADRFQLKFHSATRNIPVYALVIAKGGLKLKEADTNNLYAHGQQLNNSPLGRGSIIMTGVLIGQGITIAHLIDLLNYPDCELDRVVVDETGLTKEYDVTLRWATFQPGGSSTVEGARSAVPDNTVLSIFTALQEQLGLKLKPTKAPIDIIVVDHIEKPSEN